MNKERRNAQSRKYRKDNPEKWKSINKASKLKRADSIAGYMKTYRSANAEKISTQNASYRAKFGMLMNERTRLWRKKNPGTYLASKAKRRAQELRAMPAWADVIKIREIYKKASELSKLTGVLHHVDHIIPLCGKLVCGLHVHENLEAIPAVENMKKSNQFDPA